MSLFCETLQALSFLTFLCPAPPERAGVMPEQSDDVFGYDGLEETEKPLSFPPIIVEKEIEKTVPVEVPVEVPASRDEPAADGQESPADLPRTLKPSPVVEAGLATRRSLTVLPAALEFSNPVTPPAFTLAGAKQPAPTGRFAQTAALPPESGPRDKRYDFPGSESSLPVDNRRIVTADRYITGVIETGINSQLGSTSENMLVIQTSRDVFGYHGRLVLIPRGSRLLCDYTVPDELIFSRLSVSCRRVLLGSSRAEIITIAQATDRQGRAGLPGGVDQRFWEQYGTAILFTAISAGVAGLAQLADDGTTATTIGEAAGQNLAQNLGQITAQALQSRLDTRPVITVAQGTRVHIRPKGDWYIHPPD